VAKKYAKDNRPKSAPGEIVFKLACSLAYVGLMSSSGS
jgi:hypothetical protein